MQTTASSGVKRGCLALAAGCVLLLAVWLGGSSSEALARTEDRTSSSAEPSPAATQEEGKDRKRDTKEYQLSRERYEKAVAYSRVGYTLYFVSVAWAIVRLLLLLRWKIVAGLRDFAERRSPRRVVQGLWFVPPLLLLLGLLDLPLRIYGHHLSLVYAQSVEGWGAWFGDWAKGEVVRVGIGLVVVAVLFPVMRWKPRTWWLYFWLASIPLVVFGVFLSPWLLDPLFNQYRPLGEKHPDLVRSIGILAERAGIALPPERMYLMLASAKTNELNAYVTGIGASKRMVVWDTTLEHLTPDEVLSVVGHEMGHYVLGHVGKGLAFALAATLFGLYLAYRLFGWVLQRWGGSWSVRGPTDWAALAVLLLLSDGLGFLAEPVANGFSRRLEHEADVYGLELTHGILEDSREAAAHSFEVMGEVDLEDPNPPRFIAWWIYSHPPVAERLKFAHDYDPWGKGEPPKFVK